MGIIILEDWLNEQGYGMGPDTADPTLGGPPSTDAYVGGPVAPAASPQGDPNIAGMPNPPQEEEEDLSNDPQAPDMPEDDEEIDFETWKKKFLTESIKGDVLEMKDLLLSVRNRNLDNYQEKFVEDNLRIVELRELSNIDKASKEIRKEIKTDLDTNNPGTSLVNHMTKTLQEMPLLNNIFIKLTGLYGAKSDPHRKYLASLLGAVQVGNGGASEDLIYNERDYSIRISTRINSRFGEVYLGDWSLKVDDPERYLEQPELKRLEDGSPEEKKVLRKRIVMESIAEQFKTRTFIINVVGTDGTIYTLGWDLSTSLKAAYTEGQLVVEMTRDDNTDAMITDDGEIVPFMDMVIKFVYQTDKHDDEGKPITRRVPFMRKKHGQLYLEAELPVIKEASTSFQGIVLKELPWQGNPSDLQALKRCVPSTFEILTRQC